MNNDEIVVRHSTLRNGAAGLIISLMTCSEISTPVLGSVLPFLSRRVCLGI